MRSEQHLERPRSRRLARLDVVERDRRLRGAHRRVEVGRGADRRADARQALGAGLERGSGAGGDEAGASSVQRGTAERSAALVDEDEDVVELVGKVEGRPGVEPESVEREL